MNSIDKDLRWADIYRRFRVFQMDNGWKDQTSSFYTPKQNIYRVILGDSVLNVQKTRLNFEPKSFEEFDMMLTLMGY